MFACERCESSDLNTSEESKESDFSEGCIIVDVGASLTNRKFQRDLDSVISRSVDAGISPHEAKSWTEETGTQLAALAANPECVAVGSCGLDLQRLFSPLPDQLNVLHQQVQLACLLNKPLLLHERGAQQQLLSVLQEYGKTLPPVIIQCFSGTILEAEVYLSKGFYLALSGSLWKENGMHFLQQGVLPIERMLLQSEAPYMYPNPRLSRLPPEIRCKFSNQSLHRLQCYCSFQRNEPCSLSATLELAAALFKISPADLALTTTYNALHLFGLST